MSSRWISDAQNVIYTKVDYRTCKQLKTKYADIRFTMDDESQITAKFPTVYIHFLPFAEQGRTLESTDVNGILCAVQVEVTTSKQQGRSVASDVMYEVIDQFKKMRFELYVSPEFMTTGNETKRIVARLRRIIGANDTIE